MIKKYFLSWTFLYFVFWLIAVLTAGSVLSGIIMLVSVVTFLFAIREIFKGILKSKDPKQLKNRGRDSLIALGFFFLVFVIYSAIFTADSWDAGMQAVNATVGPTTLVWLSLMTAGIICLVRGHRLAQIADNTK
jgi:hypothetical protein